MIYRIIKKIPVALAITGLVSCIGGGNGQLAGGGISGSGTGTITGFGSVIINEVREFEIDADTTIIWDGNIISEQDLIDRGIGAVAQIDVTGANDGLTSGTAVTIHVGNQAKGPITGINPIRVLGQRLVFDGNVVYIVDDVPVPAIDLSTLAVGDTLEVNGFADDMNVIQVSLLEYKTADIPVWKLVGKVTATTPGEFSIGTQRVLMNGVIAQNCAGPAPATGEIVDVTALLDSLFNTGAAPNDDTLDTITAVECLEPGLGVPPGTAGTVIEAGIEGIVGSLACTGGDFVVGGQCVEITSVPAAFAGGTAEDIVPGAKLEAEGDLDTTTGILSADRIRFREKRVRIEAPVNVPGSGVGNAFTLLDVINVNTTLLTGDSDGIIDGSGSTGNLQLEVRGYVDNKGNVFATSLSNRGIGDASDVRLRGPTSDTCDPLSGDTVVTILGVLVDTDSSAFPLSFLDGTIEPAVPLADNVALCALIGAGSGVEVDNGVFTSAPATIDDAGVYSIEDL
jgi:hypothetical protein